MPQQVQAYLATRLSLAQPVSVTDAVRQGQRRIFFTVASLTQADSLVRARHALRGSGVALLEVLSPEEEGAHALLWPVYVAARDQGKRAQFRRAQLFIDGVRVLPAAA
jgi:hypothetical protein